MGLPGSIQAYEQPIGLPAGILKNSDEVRSHGGSQAMMENLQTLKVLAQDCWNLTATVSCRPISVFHSVDQKDFGR